MLLSDFRVDVRSFPSLDGQELYVLDGKSYSLCSYRERQDARRLPNN